MKRDKWDSLFSRYIKLLSGGYCKRCGKFLGLYSQGLHCAHWQSRGEWTTRYEKDNACALCYGCHSYLDHNPKGMEEKDELFFRILGTKRANEILELSEKTLKDLGLTKKTLREKVEKDLRPKIKLLTGVNE